MNTKLDVSTGSVLDFTYGGVAASGLVVGSRVSLTKDRIVEVNLITQSDIPKGASLNIPGFIEGVGLAQPFVGGGGYQVILQVPYALVERSSISGR